ncbi:hypothetical protein QBD00_000043 [Ochrobactrum sp. AN78]|nr:hypothetical protein [Ochrobactrum sp. AN78]
MSQTNRERFPRSGKFGICFRQRVVLSGLHVRLVYIWRLWGGHAHRRGVAPRLLCPRGWPSKTLWRELLSLCTVRLAGRCDAYGIGF